MTAPVERSCCQRFADPGRTLAELEGIDLERAGRSHDGGRLTVTARGLLLTRDGTVQHGRDEVYGPQGWRLAPWHHDTYWGGLALDAATLRRFAGARVLDLAAGLSIFATEAASLGLEVDCVDLELVASHPGFALAQSWIGEHYAEQLELLHCLHAHAGHPRYALDADAAELLARLHPQRHDIARRYPAAGGRRFRDDARCLDSVADGCYPLVLCGWLATHLDDADQRRVLESAVRVTESGGEVRIKAGYGIDARETFRRCYGSDVANVAGRGVRLAASCLDDRLVLTVA